MGRGRAKAKQTKVARQLKYNSRPLDADRLMAEIGHPDDVVEPLESVDLVEVEDDDDEDDPYAEYAAKYGAEDDEDDDSQARPA